jgi:hypothetical protein
VTINDHRWNADRQASLDAAIMPRDHKDMSLKLHYRFHEVPVSLCGAAVADTAGSARRESRCPMAPSRIWRRSGPHGRRLALPVAHAAVEPKERRFVKQVRIDPSSRPASFAVARERSMGTSPNLDGRISPHVREHSAILAGASEAGRCIALQAPRSGRSEGDDRMV